MIYRLADDATRRRRDELLAERRRELTRLPDAILAVVARRRARVMAGATGVAWAVFLALCAALRRDGLTAILHASWACMAVVYVFARVIAGEQVRRDLARVFSPGSSPGEDILRLEGLTPILYVRDLADRLERQSVALPIAALALLLPLSLHYLAAATLRAEAPDTVGFDHWISLSLLVVGHCHVVLAMRGWRFAAQLRGAADVYTVGILADRAGWEAWGTTILSSVAAGVVLMVALPIAGIALVVVAPAIVAATGLFIPAMFSRMGKKIREERLLVLGCDMPPG